LPAEIELAQDNSRIQVSGQVQLNQINPNVEDNDIAEEDFASINIGSMDVKVAEKLELTDDILQRAFEMIDKDQDGYVSMMEIKTVLYEVEF